MRATAVAKAKEEKEAKAAEKEANKKDNRSRVGKRDAPAEENPITSHAREDTKEDDAAR